MDKGEQKGQHNVLAFIFLIRACFNKCKVILIFLSVGVGRRKLSLLYYSQVHSLYCMGGIIIGAGI